MDDEIAKVVKNGVDEATLTRVTTKIPIEWNDKLEMCIHRVDTLAMLQTL